MWFNSLVPRLRELGYEAIHNVGGRCDGRRLYQMQTAYGSISATEEVRHIKSASTDLEEL